MFMVPRRSSQTIPDDVRSPTHSSQPRGWPQFNWVSLTCFITKMLVPKGQPGPPWPQPCSSKFTERLEECPRGQNYRVRQVPRQSWPLGAVRQMLVANTLFVVLIPQIAPGKRFPTPNLSSHYVSFFPETAACSGGQAVAESSPNLSTRQRTIEATDSQVLPAFSEAETSRACAQSSAWPAWLRL